MLQVCAYSRYILTPVERIKRMVRYMRTNTVYAWRKWGPGFCPGYLVKTGRYFVGLTLSNVQGYPVFKHLENYLQVT